MATRGRRPKNLPPHDPDQYVMSMRRGKVCWHPDILPALLAWIDMNRRIHEEALREAESLSNKTATVIRRQTIDTLKDTIRGLDVIAAIAAEPWRRLEWNPSVIKVMDAIDRAHAETFPDASPTG